MFGSVRGDVFNKLCGKLGNASIGICITGNFKPSKHIHWNRYTEKNEEKKKTEEAKWLAEKTERSMSVIIHSKSLGN